jgi:hypothetical protein
MEKMLPVMVGLMVVVVCQKGEVYEAEGREAKGRRAASGEHIIVH